MAGFASKVVQKMMRQYGLFDSLDEMPSVSVVIPAFNEAGYIANAVHSALNSNYKGHVDVSVIDDGSTDQTGRAAKDAGANVYRTGNRGVSTARNYGMRKAKGDIVMIMDADSEMPKGAIERAVESAKKGYIAGSFSKSSCHPMDDLFNGCANAVNSILMPARNIIAGLPASGSGTLMYVRKDVVERNGVRFREGQTMREDSDFLAEMSKYGWVDFIGDVNVKTSPRRSEGKSFLQLLQERARTYVDPTGVYEHIKGRGAA